MAEPKRESPLVTIVSKDLARGRVEGRPLIRNVVEYLVQPEHIQKYPRLAERKRNVISISPMGEERLTPINVMAERPVNAEQLLHFINDGKLRYFQHIFCLLMVRGNLQLSIH